MSRIPYPSLDNLSPVKHERIFDPARKYLLNVTKMSLHVPDGLWGPLTALARATVRDATLEKRLKEMLIIRVGYLEKSEYELFHHNSIAAHAGISAEKIAALQGGDLSCLASDERAFIDFVTEVVRDVSPGDATMQNARAHFSDELLFEAVVIVGYYMLTARVIGVGGVDLEEKPVTTW